MSREQLEEKQIWVYTVALGLGVGLGLWRPTFGASLESFISPVLAVLLYGMFAQIPFLHLCEAFANRRFTVALLTVNFVVVPVLVFVIIVSCQQAVLNERVKYRIFRMKHNTMSFYYIPALRF